MRHQAEINKFAVFLFCSLVPLGSLAPTATSEESKTIMRQKRFTTSIKSLAAVIEEDATELFQSYNKCMSVTPQTTSWLSASSQINETVQSIPECLAFDADCCTLHIFYNILQYMSSDMEFICGKSLALSVKANIRQLNVTLSEEPVPYACKNNDIPQVDHSQVQGMKTAEKMMYIWQVLQKYEQFMQNTTKIYSA